MTTILTPETLAAISERIDAWMAQHPEACDSDRQLLYGDMLAWWARTGEVANIEANKGA